MSTHRPFRFGVQAGKAADRASWVELARKAESLGYATLTMPDHFDKQWAPVPALMAAADATTTLRIGALVFDNDYKHPVVLAKELATMDVLSDGRVEVGLGAGWMVSDYQQAGMMYDRPGVRIDRFEEGLAVVKGLFAEGPLHFEGRHYRIDGLDGFPKPLQQPRPPLLIGGGGQRVLGIAAREADIIGINFTLTSGRIGPEVLTTLTEEAVLAKLAWARLQAEAFDRADQIEWNIRCFFVSITDDREGSADGIAKLLGVSVDDVLASPFALVGRPDQLADVLRERRERLGFSYVIVGEHDVEAFAPVVAALAGT